MDPDTGMMICMIQDSDGFRPATAVEEFQSIDLAFLVQDSQDAGADTANEGNALVEFVSRYEQAYGSPPPSMA
ncbi:hypothetical protein [Polaromonas sp.]|uniref:hypothetical protein n=1 Tax=Polaromonas sp. TaxID=1869339 RepID=UPI00352B26FD